MKELHDKYSSQGLVILGVSDESESTLAAFIKAQGINYTIAVDQGGKNTKAYKIKSYPTAYLIGANGKVIGSQGHEQAIEEALKEARIYFKQELKGKLKSFKGLIAKKQYGKAYTDLEKLLPKLEGSEEAEVAQSLMSDLKDYADSYKKELDSALSEKDLFTAVSALQTLQTVYKGSSYEKEAKEKVKELQKGEETKSLYKGALVLIQAQELVFRGDEKKAQPLLESILKSFPNTPLATQAKILQDMSK